MFPSIPQQSGYNKRILAAGIRHNWRINAPNKRSLINYNQVPPLS